MAAVLVSSGPEVVLDDVELPPLVEETVLPVEKEGSGGGDEVRGGVRGASGAPGGGLDEDAEPVDLVRAGQELGGELNPGDVGVQIRLAGDEVVLGEGTDKVWHSKDLVELGDELVVVEVDPVGPVGVSVDGEDGLSLDVAGVAASEGHAGLGQASLGQPDGVGAKMVLVVGERLNNKGSRPATSTVSRKENRVREVAGERRRRKRRGSQWRLRQKQMIPLIPTDTKKTNLKTVEVISKVSGKG